MALSSAERGRKWREKNADRLPALKRGQRLGRDPLLTRETQRAYRTRLRDEAYAAYGGSCTCCGERTPEFLNIDHVDGGGNDHRRSGYKGIKLCLWLRAEGYPPEFQLLCANCNTGRARNGGTCPHLAAAVSL